MCCVFWIFVLWSSFPASQLNVCTQGLSWTSYCAVRICVLLHSLKKMSRGSHELEVKESVMSHSFSSLHWQVGERSDWPVLSAFLLHDWSVLSITLGKLLPHTCDVLDPKVEYCHCTDFFKAKNCYRLNSRHHLHSIVLKCIQCKKSCKIFSYFVIVFVRSCMDYLCHYLGVHFLQFLCVFTLAKQAGQQSVAYWLWNPPNGDVWLPAFTGNGTHSSLVSHLIAFWLMFDLIYV